MQNNIKLLLSVVYFFIAFLFWGICFPYHLLYQEQYLLFLYTNDYLLDKLLYPGGICEYVAEFLTQFYYYPWLGAIIVSFCLWAIHIVMYRIMNKIHKEKSVFWYVLSFIPSLVVWSFLCDENSLLAGAISLLVSMTLAYGYMLLSGIKKKYCYVLLMTPFAYWSTGGLSVVMLGLILVYEWIVDISATMKTKVIVTLILVLSLLVSVCLAISYLHYPALRLLTGLGYYRFPTVFPLTILSSGIIVILIGIIIKYLPIYSKSYIWPMAFYYIVILVIGVMWIYSVADMKKERDMAYDYWVRTSQWQRIITAAEDEIPDTPLSVVCLNLALGKTGQLGERMFQFFQNGTEGLIPDFVRDYTLPLTVNEVYYHLGMINTSQRYVFEAMEANPSYHKSARCISRLVETNILNGDYRVASKYLSLLKHTLFYRKWAEQTEEYLYNEEKIDLHPEWGNLRKIRYEEDFLFSENEKDMMLGLLLVKNKSNRLAFEYLLAYTLLKRDVNSFLKYYPLGKNMGYNFIPRSYQEALVYVWTQTHPNFHGIPWSISPIVMKEVTEFATHYIRKPNDEAFFKNRFGKSYWYYLLFRK